MVQSWWMLQNQVEAGMAVGRGWRWGWVDGLGLGRRMDRCTVYGLISKIPD